MASVMVLGAPIGRHDDGNVCQDEHRLISAVLIGAFPTHDSKRIAAVISCVRGFSRRSCRIGIVEEKPLTGGTLTSGIRALCSERLTVGRIERVKNETPFRGCTGTVPGKEIASRPSPIIIMVGLRP